MKHGLRFVTQLKYLLMVRADGVTICCHSNGVIDVLWTINLNVALNMLNFQTALVNT